MPYNDSIPGEIRVQAVLDWLRLPVEHRPHLITLYFSAVDSIGHRHGPDSTQVRDAVQQVDGLLATLFRGLETVQPAVNVIVVSDHGMVRIDRTAHLTDHADWSGVTVINQGSMIMLYTPDKQKLVHIEEQLRSRRSLDYRVYRREKGAKTSPLS